ncbi:MAG: hypothetical protein ACRCUT_13585 [Spirochaetota bacterium]
MITNTAAQLQESESAPERKGFVDFVGACAKDSALGKEFIMKMADAKTDELVFWFRQKGFEMTVEECATLVSQGKGISKIKETAESGSY